MLDTNVIVSALAYPRSTPRIVLDTALSQSVVLASIETLGELARVLSGRKMRRYLGADEAVAFLAMYSQKIVPVVVTSTQTNRATSMTMPLSTSRSTAQPTGWSPATTIY